MKETPHPVELFCSYARADERWLKKLEIQLSQLVRHQQIAPWHQQMIVPGQNWKQEIEAHLNSAQVILLLISPDFLASDYCYSTEMQLAIERHRANKARVIPIILSDVVGWQNTPLAELQSLPSNHRPVDSWNNKNKAFYDVVEGIQHAINDLVKNEQFQEASSAQSLSTPIKSVLEPFNFENLKNMAINFAEKIHQKYISDICFAGDTPCCISTSHDCSIVFYNIKHQKVDFTLKIQQDNIQAIAYHPILHLLAGINQRGEIILWETHTYQQEKTLFSGERYLTDVAFSIDGMFLCAISRRGTGWCWRTDTWDLSHSICQFNDAACSVAFSSDGIYLAVACLNGDLVIWNCQTWTQVNSYSFDGELTTVQFIPGHPILALGFEHGEIRLWDYNRSSLLASLIHHSERITDFAMLSNGELFFSSSNDQRLVAWDLEKRKSIYEISTENDVPLALAINPEETILAVGTASGRILWYTTHK